MPTKAPKVHLATSADRTRCNRLGMRTNREGQFVRILATTGDPETVTCDDCVRLAALDQRKARAPG